MNISSFCSLISENHKPGFRKREQHIPSAKRAQEAKGFLERLGGAEPAFGTGQPLSAQPAQPCPGDHGQPCPETSPGVSATAPTGT